MVACGHAGSGYFLAAGKDSYSGGGLMTALALLLIVIGIWLVLNAVNGNLSGLLNGNYQLGGGSSSTSTTTTTTATAGL